MNESISIFLVDDHRIFTQSFQVFVSLQERFTWRGSSAGDRRTIADILHFRPSVVLMDYHLPGIDGLETTRRIRAAERDGRRVAVIGVTASASLADRESCLAAGMDDYVPKPVGLADLGAAPRGGRLAPEPCRRA